MLFHFFSSTVPSSSPENVSADVQSATVSLNFFRVIFNLEMSLWLSCLEVGDTSSQAFNYRLVPGSC